MKTILTLADFKSMFDGALAAIKAREAEFSQLDAVLGDGDHGQAIVTAMSVVVEKAQTGAGFKSMLILYLFLSKSLMCELALNITGPLNP